jgi:pilus assembly protein CpaE
MSMMPLAAAVLISNRPLWEQAHACIQNLPVRISLESSELSDIDGLCDRIERHRADVVLVEASRLSLPLDQFVRRLRDMPSQPALFVVHTELSPQHILEALRAGATEYLNPPLAETLRDAFQRLSETRSRNSLESAGGLGRIFGFISARGGCGTTTFIAHAAPAVARSLSASTLLADFDFDAGMLRFIMKCRGSWSVRDALDNMHRMDSNYWKKLVSEHSRNLDMIPAPDELVARRPGDPQETAQLMRFIRSTYQAALVDFGRHVSVAALDALPELDTLYLVTTLDLDSLDHAGDCLRHLEQRGYPLSRVKVLVNRIPERGAPDPAGIEKYLGIPCAASFSSDHASLYDAWSEGRLLEANTKLGRELQGLAASIAARVRGVNTAPAQEPKRGVAGSARPAGRLLSFFQRSGGLVDENAKRGKSAEAKS